MASDNIIERFISTFGSFNDMIAPVVEGCPLPPEMDGGLDDTKWARQLWKPGPIRTDRRELDRIYGELPNRFPVLYENLLLSYRWFEVTLGQTARLFANPPGPDLRLLAAMTTDSALAEVLFPEKLIPFARANSSYDPLCFDTANWNESTGDCPILRVEHENILCNGKMGEKQLIARSFQEFVEAALLS